jgi:hypothetical protein
MYPYSWKHDCFEVSKKEYNTICIICDEILQIMVRNIFEFFFSILTNYFVQDSYNVFLEPF